MAHEIQKTRVRDRLPNLPYEPYWRMLERGRALGFRKVPDENGGGYKGFWIARMRPDESSRKYEYEPLGEVKTDFGWDEAKAAAEAWFKLRAEGVITDAVEVVEAACRAYVQERR